MFAFLTRSNYEKRVQLGTLFESSADRSIGRSTHEIVKPGRCEDYFVGRGLLPLLKGIGAAKVNPVLI